MSSDLILSWEKSQQVRTLALIQAVHMWKDGYLNYLIPDTEETDKILSYLQSFIESGFEVEISDEEEVNMALNVLLTYNIFIHFQKVASHRRWIRLAYELALNANVPDLHEGLKERIENHDLSMYGPDEALGYSIGQMFGTNGNFQELTAWEMDEHEKSVANHMQNRHHPEKFKNGEEMTQLDLQESLLDMVAAKFERDLQHRFCMIHHTDLFNFPQHYYARYTEYQEVYIRNMINIWANYVHNLIGPPNNGFCTNLMDPPTMEDKILHEQWTYESGLNIGCVNCSWSV